METLSFAEWKSKGFPGVPKSAVVLSRRPSHWTAWAIYDGVGIVGQIGGVLPKIGNWLRTKIQVSFANFCSESVIEIRRKVRPNAKFCGDGPAQQSPADVNAWIAEMVERGLWKQYTVKLVA